jgi:membrane protein
MAHYGREPTSRLSSIGLLLKEATSEWFRDDALRLSAAVSFYAVLSLAPLLAIVIRVMGIVHASIFAREQLLKQTTNLMGPQVANAIKPIIENNFTQSAGYGATTISTVVLLFSATSVFIELRNSMNSIWGVALNARERNPGERAIHTFIRARLLSLAMVFGLGLLLVISMFISGTLTAFQQYIVHVDRMARLFRPHCDFLCRGINSVQRHLQVAAKRATEMEKRLARGVDRRDSF